MINGNTNLVTLARELVEAEDNYNAALARFSAAVANYSGGAEPLPTITAKAAKRQPVAAKKAMRLESLPARLRAFLEKFPGERRTIAQIRDALPDVGALALRKALYNLTQKNRHFKRDKRARGVYYFAG
jgi:hypothetical protein